MSDGQALREAWNEERLREGDKVGDGKMHHPNQYSTRGTLTTAWRQIGNSRNARQGLDGTNVFSAWPTMGQVLWP